MLSSLMRLVRTPPELLIGFEGKKVGNGDHRQLPPMLDTSTLEEALAIGSTREQFDS